MTKPKVGDVFQFRKKIFDEEVAQFANLTGDYNPLHLDENFVQKLPLKKRIVHGMLVASLTSRLVGMELSYPGALWTEQNFRFVAPVFIGDRLNFFAEILQVSLAAESLKIRITVKKGKKTILEGEGRVVLRYGK